MTAETTMGHDDYEHDGFEWTWPVIVLTGVILAAVVGLICAFALHSSEIGAFIGIGIAAAFAPICGMIFLAWAIDNDENRAGAGGDAHGH